jgi:hypothetical protein
VTPSLRYETCASRKWTFEDPNIREWVESRLRGRVLNLCAGKTVLEHPGPVVRNDLDEERDADLHVDAAEIADHVEPSSFDTVVFDPPFSVFQANKTYEGETVGYDRRIKEQIDAVLRPGGRVLQFGYTTSAMPSDLGYERDEVVVFNTYGRMNDILATLCVEVGEP